MEEIAVNDIDSATAAVKEETGEPGNTDDHMVDNLLESIWDELGGTVERESIKLAFVEAETKYQQAQVKTFVPILMRRHILKILRNERAHSQQPAE